MPPFDSQSTPYHEEVETLLALLDAATPISERYFQQPIKARLKPDNTPVTLADTQIEEEMRRLLRVKFPDDGILGEEMGKTGKRDRMWVVDPIDGTKSFMHGNPLYGHLVSFAVDGVPVLGGMGFSALDELWIGVTGSGAWRRKRGTWAKVSTRSGVALDEAALLCTTLDMFDPAETSIFEAVVSASRYVRYGADCFNYACIAGGWADIAIESQLQPYDFMALVPLIKEAGGEITDWSGNAINIDSGPQLIASATPDLHAAALALMNP